MARRKVHLRKIGHIPCRHDDASAVGIVFDIIHSLLYLVDMSTVIVGPRTPLITVDMSQITCLRVGPFVPDTHSVLLKVLHIGVSLQEPEQFVYDRLQMHLLGGEQGEPFLQVITALMAKDTDGARARAVMLLHALIEYLLHQIKILFHIIRLCLKR